MWVWKCDPQVKHELIFTPLTLVGLLAILLSINIFSYIKMYVYFSNVNITIYVHVVNNDFQIIYMHI